MLAACAAELNNILDVSANQKTGSCISLDIKTPLPTKIRPSYPSCEGSRGTIKTDSGDNVELSVINNMVNLPVI